MKSLYEIMDSISHTDKYRKPDDSGHSYSQLYESWFAPFRDKPINFLEIGISVFGGGGVLSFAEFFPKAQIWGIDVTFNSLIPAVKEHPRIHLVERDAYISRPEYLRGHDAQVWFDKDGFDIIIEDAVHNAPEQRRAVELYWPLVKPGGIYVCEDTYAWIWRENATLHMLDKMFCKVEVFDMSDAQSSDNCLAKFIHKGSA